MENEQIYNALVSIRHAERTGQSLELFPNSMTGLQQQGLISIMQPDEYDEKRRQILPMRDCKEHANASADLANELSEQIDNLEAKLNSRLHKWFSSDTKLSAEREELAGLRSAYGEAKQGYERAKADYDSLKQIKNELREYVSAGRIYVRLTHAGDLTLNRLESELEQSRNSRQENTQDFESVDTRRPLRSQSRGSARREVREREPDLLGYAVDGIAGAVAGDVLDNGRIDGSGGALVGGALGVAARASGSRPLQRATEGAGLGGLIAGPPGAFLGGAIGLGLGALDDDDDDRLF